MNFKELSKKWKVIIVILGKAKFLRWIAASKDFMHNDSNNASISLYIDCEMRAFYYNYGGVLLMPATRKSAEEQYRLIMECRTSGLSDYQWCTEHAIILEPFITGLIVLSVKPAMIFLLR